MKWFVGIVLLAATAGLLFVLVERKPADVYDLPVDRTYELLVNVDFGELSEGQRAVELQRTSVGNGFDSVTWRTRASHVSRSCDLKLAPFDGDAARTHITVTCNGGGAGEGAAAGMAHNIYRDSVIERIDATLTGRPFDSARAVSTSSRWPSDGVDGSYGTAVATALEMDREVREMQAEASRPRSPEEIHAEKMDAFYAGE